MTSTQNLIDRESLFLGGEWVTPASGETIDVINPTTEEVMARVPAGTAADIDRAVAAARAAFDGWAATPLADRVALCTAVSLKLQERQGELADLIAREMGSPLSFAVGVQTALPVMSFAAIERMVEDLPWEERLGNSLIVREPVGVVGAITPWNYPLHQVAAKVAPALAVGCTVVVKPSEVAPLSAFVLADIMAEVGLPPGVFNLVTGYGPVAGEALSAHPGIDMISFTGSTRAGRRVSELAAGTVKKVALELGGKSANIILDDADLQRAVSDGMIKCYLNSGQTCSALTRMLVPVGRLAEAEQIAARVAGEYQHGDPSDPGTRLGPLVSSVQLERVRSYIQKGIDEGATLVVGGVESGRDPADLGRGYYVPATVFSGVTPEMTIAREEIFGPVLSIMPYQDEDDAVRIANDTEYGLAGGVWSADPERALRVARRLRAGQIEVNGGAFNPGAPFGGYKQSGVGREGGAQGLEEFLETKAIQR
jgi:aldehyde dehydrogenase (NAD+)